MAPMLTVHPLAEIVPPMTPEEYKKLKENIKAHGQREPITLYEGKIIDGAHRYRACRELGIQPKTRELRDEEPLDFIISENVARRHLSVGQIAALAVAMAEEMRARFPASDNGTDIKAVADHLGTKVVSSKAQLLDVVAPVVGAKPHSAEVFQTLQKQAPKLAKQVAAGTMDLYAADDVRRRAARGAPSPSGRPSPEKRAILALQAAANTAKQLRREIQGLEPLNKDLLEPNLMIALYTEVAAAAYALQRLVQRARVDVPKSGREVKLIAKGG